MRSGWRRYAAQVFVRPRAAFGELLNDPRRMTVGVVSMLLMSAAYTLVCIFLAVIPGTPNPAPFLRIPSDRYFYWASYFYALALLSAWIFGSAVTYLLARLLAGRGSFDDTFALLGFATAAATLFTLAPDLALTFPQAIGAMDYGPWFYSVTHYGAWFYVAWAYIGLYLVYFCVFYPVVVRVVHGISTVRAIVVGLAGFAAYQGFVFVFIR